MTDLPALPWERIDDRSALATRMAAWAAREIIELRHGPGAFLVEADLAAAQGGSRTPAREAMLQLERWGLVRLVPKKGAVVTSVAPHERRDLLAVRAMFEIDAVRALTTDQVGLRRLASDLGEPLARQRAALEAGDPLAFASNDYAFHARIIAGGGNVVVDELLDALAPRLARLTFQVALEQPAPLGSLLAEHQELTERASEGDTAGFADLVRRHIEAGHFPEGGAR